MSCCVGPYPGLLHDGVRSLGQGKRRRSSRKRRAESSCRSNLSEGRLHSILDFPETLRTVGVCLCDLGWIYTVGLTICPPRQPAIKTEGKTGIASNEFADATNGEQRRCDECPFHLSGKHLIRCLSERFTKSHTPPFCSFIHGQKRATGDLSKLVMDINKNFQSVVELGNPPVLREQFTSLIKDASTQGSRPGLAERARRDGRSGSCGLSGLYGVVRYTRQAR